MSIVVPDSARLSPQVMPIVVAHAERGIALQQALRAVLVLFVVATVIWLPPAVAAGVCAVIAAGYVLAAAGLTWWLHGRGGAAIRWGWLGLYVDLAVLSAVSLVAGLSARQSWTSYVLLGGFFLLPVLAATQLRWRVCVGVVVPTVAVYLLEGVLTREGDEEPWASVILRTLALVGVGVAAIGLSRIQRSRVAAIAELVADRNQLLTELMTVTDTERRRMAEDLHDNALQYVLAARFDAEDARETAEPAAFDRLDQALTQSAQLLRTTVSELHPAVLEQSGLAAAVTGLARTAADRGGLDLDLDVADWPASARTPADLLLFGTARELLANVVRHAGADRVRVELRLLDGRGELVVTDDGVGADPATVAGRLAQGHIGLNSQRVRIEAAGGSFALRTPPSGGTVVAVSVPVPMPVQGRDVAP
jgi:two-component system NarL family sensor kinase